MNFSKSIFSIWIRCYCYNNEYLLFLRRKYSKRKSAFFIMLSLPYILVRWLSLSIYETLFGKRLIHKRMSNDLKINFDHEIAMVSISKNEGPYIKEWIEFHKLVGFTKFYFYDNESEDNTLEILKPYINCGLVEYTKMIGDARQLDAYNDAICKHKNECRYMAFCDMDEYLMPMKPYEPIYKIVSQLIKNEGKGAVGIGVNWCIFGSSHLENTPKGLVTGNFIYRGTEEHWGNFHIKTICNPRMVKNYISPHYPIYKLGGYNINDSNGNRLWGWFCHDVRWKTLRINHYFSKSKEQYVQKISRGLGDRSGRYDMAKFYQYDLNEVRDDSMNIYKDKLEKVF